MTATLPPTRIGTALHARDLSVRYGATTAVDAVDLHVDRGEIVSLIGPNGSGKSSLLSAVVGRIRSTGRVWVDGRDLRAFAPRDLARTVGMLGQRNVAPTDMTVRELVGYGRHPHRRFFERPSARDRAEVAWAMDGTGVTDFADRPVAQLSGGESQRVWLAMSLAQRPTVLLLDEPTTYLDIAHQHEILELVVSLRDTVGLTVLMVLHDLNQAATFSDRVLALSAGRLVAEGDPTEVLTPTLIREVYRMEATVDHVAGRPRIHLLRSLHRPDAPVRPDPADHRTKEFLP